MRTTVSDRRPAILGGPPARPTPLPEWPQQDVAVCEMLIHCFHKQSWGRYSGEFVPKLATALRYYHQCEHVTLCSSGTVGVELALRGLGVQSGDEVILAGYDFKGNFLNVVALGAIPVLVDIHPDDGQINVELVTAAVTEKTRVILASHLHGGLVDMPALRRIADEWGLLILEDACQQPGALLGGRRAGTWGDVGVISFGGSKLLSAGRGGAVLTQRTDVYERLRRHQQRGNEAYPLSELQAAVLLPQLAKLDSLRQQRAQTASQLRTALSTIDGLQPLTPAASSREPDYYKFACRYSPSAFGELPRAKFVAAMIAEGLPVAEGFRGLHQLHARRRFRVAGELTCATQAGDSWVVWPHSLLLENDVGPQQMLTAVQKIQHSAPEIAAATLRIPTHFVSPWEAT